jgi:hypothetical protein
MDEVLVIIPSLASEVPSTPEKQSMPIANQSEDCKTTSLKVTPRADNPSITKACSILIIPLDRNTKNPLSSQHVPSLPQQAALLTSALQVV